MAKKNKGVVNIPVARAAENKPLDSSDLPKPIQRSFAPSWLLGFRVQAVIVVVLSVVFYANTCKNDYALDDTAIIVQNEFVHRGLSGIKDILTKDVYYSYFKQLNTSNQLSGGRYRPLSVVTFALEQEFFGPVKAGQVDSIIRFGLGYDMKEHYEQKFLQQMHVRHFFNVAWYALAVLVLLIFLRKVVFKNDPFLALIAATLFAIHPIHTEVVANVKSRDEIMSVLFISLTFISAFRYLDSKKIGMLILALLSYFLAFLSKEYAITLLLLLPLSFYLFGGRTFYKSFLATLPYVAIAAIYVIIRLQVIGERSELADNDIQINPYAMASATEKLATEIATSLNYMKLLIFPHPLSSDYSYNQIPYKDFSHPLVWLSILVHLSLVVGFFYFLKKKHVLAFAIAFYLVNLLMICNIIFDIGATMGERLIFHSSIGFAIAAAYFICRGTERVRSARLQMPVLAIFMFMVIGLSAFKTITRNKDWKSDETLFFQDINASPNSFLVNANVGCMLINKAEFEKDEKTRIDDLQRGIRLFTRVLGMQENYVLGFMNRSVAYYKLNNADSMVADLDRVRTIYPIHPQLPNMYYHVGELYYNKKQYDRAVAEFQVCLKLDPRYTDAQKYLDMINSKAHDAK